MTSQHGLYNQFTFEKSGLPDHPTIRTAYELMLKCEIEDSPIHYKEVCIQRDIKSALYVAQGWSSDPEIISAALLRDAYGKAKDKRGFRATVGDRIASIVEDTASFETGEDDPKRRRWSDDARIVIYAECVQALSCWNESLSKTFRSIAARNEGQYVDPQYLGPHGNLIAAVTFIQEDTAIRGDMPAKVEAAISNALGASIPVTASIRAQTAARAKGYTPQSDENVPSPSDPAAALKKALGVKPLDPYTQELLRNADLRPTADGQGLVIYWKKKPSMRPN